MLCESNIIHCDLKPENVLLKGLDSGDIKVIDFGSACFENRTMYSYIQSRFYRSPEVSGLSPYSVQLIALAGCQPRRSTILAISGGVCVPVSFRQCCGRERTLPELSL